MRASAAQRGRRLLDERFRTLLAQWLAVQPADEWRGGVTELWEELFMLADRWTTFIPRGSGLSRAVMNNTATIEDAGWLVQTGRSATKRWIEFVKV
jgi:hypothetical protein